MRQFSSIFMGIFIRIFMHPIRQPLESPWESDAAIYQHRPLESSCHSFLPSSQAFPMPHSPIRILWQSSCRTSGISMTSSLAFPKASQRHLSSIMSIPSNISMASLWHSQHHFCWRSYQHPHWHSLRSLAFQSHLSPHPLASPASPASLWASGSRRLALAARVWSIIY